MERRSWRQDATRLRGESSVGVISVEHLDKLGVSSPVTYRRCQPGGPWRLILPGVILLESANPSWRQRLQAALTYGGPGAQLSGAAAAGLHGLRRVAGDGQVHLLLPHGTRRQSTSFVLVERTHRLPQPVLVHDLACAPVVRAILDRARRLRTPEAVQALIAESVQRRFCAIPALVEELEEGSSRGTALVRRELVEVSGGARSVAEVRAKRLARRTSLPEPEWNVRLFDEWGQFVGCPDGWWSDVGLAWEIDSFEYHLSPEDYARTLQRDARYAAHGVSFLPTLPSRLHTAQRIVITELEAAYAAAARRPAPVLYAERA